MRPLWSKRSAENNTKSQKFWNFLYFWNNFLFLSLFSVAGTRKSDFDFSNKETITSAVILMFFILEQIHPKKLATNHKNKVAQKPAGLNRNKFISYKPIFLSAVHMLKSEVLVLFFLKCPETFKLHTVNSLILWRFYFEHPAWSAFKNCNA